MLDRLGLTEVGGRLAKTYSGGTQRRLDVALGLIHRPEVLFLDEPTTGLDPEVRVEMWREIERLAHEEQMTMIATRAALLLHVLVASAAFATRAFTAYQRSI